MKTLYQLVGVAGQDGSELLDRETLASRYDLSNPETGTHLRPELQGQPRIKGLCGPMWGGWRDEDGGYVWPSDDRDPNSPAKNYGSQKPIDAVVIRYETWEAYEQLSR